MPGWQWLSGAVGFQDFLHRQFSVSSELQAGRLGPVDQLRQRLFTVFLGGKQQDPWEVWAGPCGGSQAGFQGVFELTVDPLHHSVVLRVVGGGAYRLEVNCWPWSKVMLVETPKWDTHAGVDEHTPWSL